MTRGRGFDEVCAYEDPRNHTFALLALSHRFINGDTLPLTGVDRWFASREEAIAGYRTS